jgi:ribosomal-protein-alanine N-acetyltransferase
MSFVVKRASMKDLEVLYRIEQECFNAEAFSKRYIASLLRAPESVSLLARHDGEVVGFVIGLVSVYGTTKIGHIMTIDVLPKHRRRGVGLKLLSEIEEEFKNIGVRVCFLEVREDNVAAKRLYEKSGYVEVERLEDFYYRGGHGIRLEKALLP